MLFSNWNDGRELPGAVMHDEVMIGTESAGGWEFVGGQEFTLLYALCMYEWAGISRNVFLDQL